MERVSYSYYGVVEKTPTNYLGNICDQVADVATGKVILLNKRTNTIATPTSVLNMVNLKLQRGDAVELILVDDNEKKIAATAKKIKKIFEGIISFDN